MAPFAEEQFATLNLECSDIVTQGRITTGGPLRGEAGEVPHLPRQHLWLDRMQFGRLQQLINALNQNKTPPG